MNSAKAAPPIEQSIVLRRSLSKQPRLNQQSKSPIYRPVWFWIFTSPFIIGLLIFVYVPVMWSGYLSFFDARNTVQPTTFVGLANYRYLLNDETFRNSLITAVVFAAVIVPVTFVCSLGLALLLDKITWGRAFFRSVFFLPTAVSYVIAAMVWRYVFFTGAKFGLANSVVSELGITPINWLSGESYWYWFVLVTLRLWLQTGFYMIIFIAGLNRIPLDSYEAAALDGATGWRTLRYVTLPQLRTTSAAVIMLLLIGAFQAFDEFYNTLNSMSGGYPPYARPPLVHLYIISLGSGSQDLGLGSAGTMIITVVIVIVGWLHSRFARPEK